MPPFSFFLHGNDDGSGTRMSIAQNVCAMLKAGASARFSTVSPAGRHGNDRVWGKEPLDAHLKADMVAWLKRRWQVSRLLNRALKMAVGGHPAEATEIILCLIDDWRVHLTTDQHRPRRALAACVLTCLSCCLPCARR